MTVYDYKIEQWSKRFTESNKQVNAFVFMDRTLTFYRRDYFSFLKFEQWRG